MHMGIRKPLIASARSLAAFITSCGVSAPPSSTVAAMFANANGIPETRPITRSPHWCADEQQMAPPLIGIGESSSQSRQQIGPAPA
ncbi:hypothetical protein T492DRAFT_978491 [Pavlovales sp. CCMP2436]|nr:hypothetical protein T492DRAFT_978491 [Pavlovales sp. CCMP2436]